MGVISAERNAPWFWGAVEGEPTHGREIGMFVKERDPDAIEIVQINARAVGDVTASWIDEVRRFLGGVALG